MTYLVSITSQGQLTIPSAVRKSLGIDRSIKAVLQIVDHTLVVTPRSDFWSLAGSLASDVRLSDTQLKDARKSFGDDWQRSGTDR